MAFSRIVVFTVLVTLASAGPLHHRAGTKRNTCALQCSEDTDNNKFDYQPGTVYQFSYDAKTTTKMNGASEDSANIHMTAMVEIEPLTKCDLVMRIKDASLRDSEDDQNSQAFKEAMMKQPLKFSFQDGRIDHVCAMDGESTWTLNIKRGILSAFQNSMDSFDHNQNVTETDVVGSCDSEYKILDEGRRVMLVKKTKNLLGCTDREGYRLAVQSIGYNVPSFVKSLPLMKSEYRCTQTLDLGSNILQSSTCTEEHVFRPFSYGKNGAMTSSEQTLTFTNKRKAGRPFDENFNQRSTLLFHHEHNTHSKQEKEDKIEAQLQELCQKAAEDIRPEVPEMVNQLIEHMRQVDRDVLSRVYDKINQKTICAPKADRIKQYFLDAIPMVGTAASVGMIQDLISKKHVTGSEAEMWLLSLSFVHHPTKEMVAATMPLLDEPDVSGNVLLAVSSLTSSYCNVRPECGKDAEISALIRKLIVLTHDCNAQNGDIRRIVLTLRALGNIGHSHEAVSHLSRCVTRRDVPEEIRIAAMDAFRRIPCDAVRSDLMGVFRDESEDSELRINAYIALMKCPSQKVLSEVREVLENEKTNQVGSFVWSHLTNLMETSDPHMQDIRNIVQDEQLKKEFNLDQKKFSRNYEGSFFFDSINTGAKVDSNVIFSQKSFIPRSANLNLTIDLFGHAINFLEFGGRIQGMETILENFFGPTATKKPKMKTQNPNNFDKKLDAFQASAYMRVFGNELRYWDDQSLREFQSTLKRLMNMQKVSFSKSMVLLDSRMTIPTCIGLPLSLTMSSTGSISLDANAAFEKLNLALHFTPSASVQVTGEMSVDAHVSKAGLKMVTVAHTSTGAKLDIRNNKFDLQIPQKKMEIFNLKTDFYIVHRNTEKKQKMIVDNVKEHEICTGKLMKQVTGLTFCQNIKFSNASNHNEAPFFPFTGPVVYDLHMINEDAPNGYKIEAFSNQKPYSIYIDTPGSKTNRLIALETSIKNKNEVEISFNAPWKNIQFEGAFINRGDLKKLSGKFFVDGRTKFAFSAQLGVKVMGDSVICTPQVDITFLQKKMKYNGAIEIHPKKSFLIKMEANGFTHDRINLKMSGENNQQAIGLATKLNIGKKEYYFDGHLGKSVSKSGFKFSPSLKITIPNKDLIELNSEITYVSTKRLSVQFTLKKVFSKTIDLNVALVHYAGKLKSKISLLFAFKSPKGTCQIIGHIDIKKSMWISSVTATYRLGNNYSDRLILSGNFKNFGTMKMMRLITNMNMKSEKYPSLRFQMSGKLSKNDKLFETNAEVQYGRPENKAVNTINFYAVAKKDLKPFSHVYNYAVSVHHPGQKINYKVEAKHVQSAKWPYKKFENKVMVQMAPGKVVQTVLSYNNAKVKGLPSHEGEISLSYPGREMKMVDKLTQVNKNTYENHFTVQWKKGQQATVQSKYTKTGKDIHNIDNTLTLPNKKEAKVTGMLQVAPGAYKTKLQFDADEGVIFRQQINYMAESSVAYTFNAKQISSDVTAEVMWAPKQKITTNLNFDYMKTNSFSGKLDFSTPFDVMNNFDSQVKSTWANRKYTSVMSVSWNKQNQLKQDFSFLYPDFQLSYDASALLSGKKSGIGLAMKYSDMSVNSNIQVSHGKTTIINVILKHNNQKMAIESKMGLDFDILDASGKMKTNLKYNKQTGELMSNGEGKLNLPVQELRQLSASYNLKHNKVLSSIDMSYSSSLKSYKNAKMMIEMKRNLPKMIKTTINLTLNGNPMFNANANYGQKNGNIDMKVDVTDPSGITSTASGNLNLSGDKKTANVEVKSRYVDFSVDGSFEYQSPRSVDGELKVTTNGKSIMINVSYKKEGTTHKVSGTLGLPDGRPIKMEGSLDLQNNLVALKTMSPDFADLTVVDLAFSFNGDRKKANVEIKSSYVDFSVDGTFEYKSSYSGVGELKVTTNGKSVTMNFNYVKKNSYFNANWLLVLPDQKRIDGNFLLNTENKIDTSFILNCPGFQRVKHIDISFSNLFDPFSTSTKGHVKILPHLEKIEFGATLSRRDNTRFNFELKTPWEKVNQVKATISSRRDSESSQIIESELLLNGNKIIDTKLHYDIKNIKDISALLQVKTSHRRFDLITVNFSHTGVLPNMKSSVNVTVGQEIKFGVKLENSDIYSEIFLKTYAVNFADQEIQLSRHGNTINNLYTMFLYKDGDQERIKYHFSINQYNPSMNISVKYPGIFSFEHFMDFYMEDMSLSLISNLETERQIYKFFVSYQHLTNLILTANAPSINHELRMAIVDKDFKISANLIYNNHNYTSIISVGDEYEKIEAEFHTPHSQNSVLFTKNGNFKNMNIDASGVHNGRETFKLTFSNVDYYHQLKTQLTTPSRSMSVEFFLKGIVRNFNTGLAIQLNHKKYEMKASNKEYTRHMNFMLNSPSVKWFIDFTNDEHERVNGNISLSLGAEKYQLTFKKEESFETSLQLSDYFELRISQTNYDLKANLKVLPYLEECKLEARLVDQAESKLNIGLKTSMDEWKHVHTTISWQKNSIFSQKVTLESWINGQKTLNMKLIYRIKSISDFTGSFEVETSHHRFKDINVDLKYFRQNLRMDSFLKMNFAREIDFEANIRNTDRMSEISVRVEPRDYDAWEMLITRSGFLDDMTVMFTEKVGGEERFSEQFFIQRHDNSFNIEIKSSIGNFEFKSELDFQTISFNLRSRMELKQKEIYKISADYEHVTKLQVKISVPSYKGELTMTADENFRTFNSSLKLKLANVLVFDGMFQNSRKVSKLSIDGQLLDYDEWKSAFEFKGDLNDMTANIITSIAKKEVNRIEASLNNFGRSINIKVTGPRTVSYQLNIDVDTEAITFNMKSSYTLDGQHTYDMIATYEHLSKLHIKVSIPYYEDELLVTFAGNLKSFNMETKFSHNNQIFELVISNKQYYRQMNGILNTPYFQDTVSFKFNGELEQMNIVAQVMHNKQQFELIFSNSGYYQQIDAKLDTPYFQPTLKFSLNGNPKKFNVELKINFNEQIYEMKASNEEYYRKMNFLLETPQLNCNFRLNRNGGSLHLSYAKTKWELEIRKGDNYDFVFRLTNPNSEREEIYEMIATYEHLAKLYIKSSFPSYNDELTLTLNGDKKMFNALAKLIHNGNKYEFIISNQIYYEKIDAQLITPSFTNKASFIFKGDQETFNAQVKFMHDNNGGNVNQPTIEIDLLCKFDAGFKRFYSASEINCCGKMYKLILQSNNYYEGMNLKLNTPSIQTKALFKLVGDLKAFNLTTGFIYNDMQYEFTLANTDYYEKINATLFTPFSQQSAMFKLKGHWADHIQLETRVTLEQGTYYLAFSNRRLYQELSANLITPFFRFNGAFTSGENLDKFKLTTHLDCADEQYSLFVSSLDYHRNLEVKVKTPFFKTEASFKLERENKQFLVEADCHYNDKQYRLSVGNVDNNSKVIAELMTPLFETKLSFTIDGHQEGFAFSTQINLNKKKYELELLCIEYYRSSKISLMTPSTKLEASLTMYGNLNTFNVISAIILNGRHYGLNVANSEYYRKIWSKLTTPHFTDSFQFNLKGNLASFRAEATFDHNKTQYKMSASNKNYYKNLNLNLSTPYFNNSLSFHLNGNLKSFNMKAAFKNNSDQYVLIASNHDYYRQISIKLTTPFSEDSASFSIDGNWDHFSSKIKVMYREEHYEFVINGHSLEIWATLKTPSIRQTAIFSLKGKSETFNLSMGFSHNNVDYKMSMSIVRYYQRINFELITPLINSQVSFNFDKETKELKTRASLSYVSQIYELVISNLDYYRSINIQIMTPSFTNTSLSYNLRGNLKSFSLETSFTHEHVQYKMSVSNKDYFRQLDANISTPFQKDSFSFHLNGDLKIFDLKTTFDHNGDNYELTVSNRDYYQQINGQLKTPYSEDSFTFLFDGNPTKFTSKLHALYNKKQYELSVSSSGHYREIDAELTTPFLHCSAMFSLNGNFESFQLLAKTAYNTKKYQIKVSNKGYFKSVNAELVLPHLNLLDSVHEVNKYRIKLFSYGFDHQLNLEMNEEFIDFTCKGNQENFNAVFTLKYKGAVYDIILRRDSSHQMHFQLNTPFVTYDFQFIRSKESVKAIFQINVAKAKHDINISGNSNDANSQHKFYIQSAVYYKQNSIVGDVTASLNKKKLTLHGHYKRFGLKKIIKAELKTPYFKDRLHLLVVGTPRKFNANMKLQHNKDVYEIIASNKNYYDELNLNFNAPGMKLKFQSEGNVQKSKVSGSLKMAADLYEVNLSNQNYFQNISLEISAPQTGSCKFDFAFQGNWNNFDVESKFSQRNQKYEVNVSVDRKTGIFVMKLFAPQMNINVNFFSDLKDFAFNVNGAFKKDKYEIMASTKNYFQDITAKLTTPQFGEQSLTVKLNGQLREFDGLVKVMINNEIYRSDFSLVNNELKWRLSFPKLREELHAKFLSVKGNVEIFMKFLHNDQRYEINLTKTKELKSHVIISHWGSMNVSMNGDLRNAHAKLKMHFGKNIFENVAQIRFDGNRLNLDVKIEYEILSRSGQFDIQVSNMIDNKSFKSQFGVKIEDVEFNTTFSLHKPSSNMDAVFTVNVPTIENSDIRFRIVSEGIHRVDAVLNLNTPWTKVSKIYYNHDMISDQYFSGKAYVEQGQFRLIGYSLHATFNRSFSIDFKCDYNNYRNKFLINGDLKFHGTVTTGVIKVDASFGILKELQMTAKISNNHLSCMLNFTQQQQRFGFKFDLSRNNGIISLNANVKTLKKNIFQFQSSYKNADQMMDISRAFNFKIVHPVRTVEGHYHLANSQHSMVVGGDLTWDLATNQKAGFELIILRGQQNGGQLRIITPRRIIELLGKVEVNGNHYSTVGHIMMDENNKAQKIDINAEIMESNDKVDIDLTVKFPNQKKGMNLKTTVNFPKGGIIFTSNSEFSIDQDPEKTFKMSTKLMSESKGKQEMYTMQMDAGHAQTGLAIDLIGRVNSSPEKYHADIEMGYLTAKGKPQKFAIRGELHRLNREVNLKLEAPSKTIELDGSIRNKNRYIVSMLKKESDKENMEALLKLNPKSQTLNIIFNYDEENPDKEYHIDAEIMATKTLLKAYRANKQNKMIEDATIDAELKPHNILKSSIRWNPHIFYEFNVFEHQKLKMYGEQLKDFGESFGQFFNGEIIGKLVSVRSSLREELLPFSGNFLAEFDAVFQDFDLMWLETKEMYQRNYFYLKSSAGTLSHLSEIAWSIVQVKMDLGKIILNNIHKQMEMEAGKIIRTVGQIYGQHKVLFTKMSSNIFGYIHVQSQKLYQSAMKVQAEINRVIESHKYIIKVINQMYQNYYGKQVIDFLMTMSEAVNEHTVQAKNHVEPLTSAIYSAHAKLNRHISNARSYPMVDDILEVFNEIYQQALWSYNYWDVNNNVLGLKDDLYKFGAEKMKEIKDIVTDVGMNTLIFNPKRGEIMVEIRFGAAKYAYNHFMSSVEDINRAVNKLSYLMPNTNLDIWDIYYMMKPSSDIEDYIPPFKAEASLFAGQHITTFDGRHFDYKGTCSYLLARDFVDGNFTVVANFDANHKAKTLKSLSVTTAHNEQVEIFANKVFFNGGAAKLPLQLIDATLTRQGNLIVLESNRGYKVMCDNNIQLYTVQISGWYFNKMGGIFGNFNHEPVDDMVMSNSQYTNDLEQFAQSWSVSRECKSHRNTALSHMIPENRECAHFFLETDSPFRYCFRQINPNYFYKTCTTQMSSHLSTSRDLCKVTSLYIRECEKRRVFLHRPAVCEIFTDKVENRSLSM